MTKLGALWYLSMRPFSRWLLTVVTWLRMVLVAVGLVIILRRLTACGGPKKRATAKLWVKVLERLVMSLVIGTFEAPDETSAFGCSSVLSWEHRLRPMWGLLKIVLMT